MIDWNRWYRYQQAMTLWQWGIVIVAISVSIWLIIWLRSHFREDADDADETLEMLTQFRELHQEGGLSDDEFRLIRSRLAHIAQGARVAQKTKSIESSFERVVRDSTDSLTETPNQSPAKHASTEKETESERMTDNKTE